MRNDGEALALEEVKVVLRSGGLPHWIATAHTHAEISIQFERSTFAC